MTTPTILIVGTDMMALYNHRLELIKRLILLGFGVTVAAPRGGEEKKLESEGVKFIDMLHVETRGKNIINDFKLLRNIVHIIKEEQPGVVLTFYTKTNIYGGIACRITHTPYIENITGLGSALINGGLMQKVMKMLYKTAIAEASNVFFQNVYNVQFFKKNRMSVKRSRLLPGSGVSLERFSILEYPEEGGMEFCFISRILEEKGYKEFIEAARILKGRHPEAVFHIIGPCDEEYLPELRAAEKEGIVIYHGKSFDIVPYLRQSHCSIFPSYYAEGMANVILESAASARPVITTSLPGCGEGVDDGVSGFIVKEKDVDDLVAKMEKFISLPYETKKQMGLNGRMKMEREFNREIVIDAYVEEINRILQKDKVGQFQIKGWILLLFI